MKPHRATLVLVFGILGLVACGVFAPIAWVMGNTDLKEMDAGIMDPMGRDMTNVGRVCGIVGSALMALALVIMLIYFVFIGVVLSRAM